MATADPWAILVFLHELTHTTGVCNEAKANCGALSAERPFLQEYLGLSADQASAVYDGSYARAMSEPAAYRPTAC